MTRYIATKRDWKLFRERIAIWQEAYMERLVEEYTQLLTGQEIASEKFWELDKRIRKDRNNPGVIITLNKGHMVYDIAELIQLGVITVDDLYGFSDELRDFVGFILGR